MDSRKPDLPNPLFVLRAPFVPENRMKGSAFVVQRKRMICALDDAAETSKAEWIDVEVYDVLEIFDRKTISTDRIPEADKLEVRNLAPFPHHIFEGCLRDDRSPQPAKPLLAKRD